MFRERKILSARDVAVSRKTSRPEVIVHSSFIRLRERSPSFLGVYPSIDKATHFRLGEARVASHEIGRMGDKSSDDEEERRGGGGWP